MTELEQLREDNRRLMARCAMLMEFVNLCDRNVRAARAQVSGKRQTLEEHEETHRLLSKVMNALVEIPGDIDTEKWLENMRADAAGAQCERDWNAFGRILVGTYELEPPPTTVAALAVRDARVRAAALEEAAGLVEPKAPRPEAPDLSIGGDDAAYDWADHELTLKATKLRALASAAISADAAGVAKWMEEQLEEARSAGYAQGARESHRAQASAVIDALGGGYVDGAPATSLNYLQLVRRIGAEHKAFGEELNNANVDRYELREQLAAARATLASAAPKEMPK